MTNPAPNALEREALKPCPMCGGDAAAQNFIVEAQVRCLECGLKVVRPHGARDDNGLPEAIAAWNRRPSPDLAGGGDKGAETGWLIEERASKTGEFKARWFSIRDGESEWTADSVAALRFGRACDAQAYIDDVGWTEAAPTEHVWSQTQRKAGME